MARKTSKSYVTLPFHPDDASFNRANALYLAHASDVAYYRTPAAAAWERLGLKTVAFRNKITRTRGFLGVCDTHAVARAIATRGKSFVEGITDHLITNYIRGLEEQVNRKQTDVRRRSRMD